MHQLRHSQHYTNFKQRHLQLLFDEKGAFCNMRRLRVFLLPPGWDASPLQGYPSVKFAVTH